MRAMQVLLCVGLLAGCAGPWPSGGTEGNVRVADVPFYPQESFQCGPAAMASVLGWSGLDIRPAALEGQFVLVRDPRRMLAEAANRYGRLAYPVTGTPAMLTELAAGHPVIILQNLGVDSRPLWNCVVAIGFNQTRGEVVVHGGDQAARRVSLRLFERLWSDADQWGLVVLKPGELPAAARREDYVKAAYNLQRSGRYWEAVLAYDAALAAWPNEPDSLMGLGSSLYLLGDARGAADAFLAAAAVSADPSVAHAALDHIRGELAASQPPIPVPQPRPARGRRAGMPPSN
ncbi:MAG: PA2778 family cysteine peptidase [Magnetospirillum sp.]|nr:PA2778 family cysteine peptidase [Magnetospirillum sp.]